MSQQTPNPFSDDQNAHRDGLESAVDLSGFDDEFDAASPPDLDSLPDGKYQVQILKAHLDKSQKGDPMIKWDLAVISGPLTGRHLFKNSVITPASLPFVKGDLKTLGLQLGKFSELPTRLEEVLDLALEVTRRTKGDYTNVYFNRRLNIPTGEGIGQRRGPAPF